MTKKSTDWRTLSQQRLALSKITGKRVDRRVAPTPSEKRLLTINRGKIERFLSGDRTVAASFQKREKARAKIASKTAEKLRRTFTKIVNLGVTPDKNSRGRDKVLSSAKIKKKDFDLYLESLNAGVAREGRAYNMPVYNSKGEQEWGVFMGEDLSTIQKFNQVVSHIDQGIADPSALKQFEGVKVRALRVVNGKLVPDRTITITGDYQKVLVARERFVSTARISDERYERVYA